MMGMSVLRIFNAGTVCRRSGLDVPDDHDVRLVLPTQSSFRQRVQMLLIGVKSRSGAAPAAPSLPSGLFGVSVWLPGSSYVAGTWTDMSGNARHATGAAPPALLSSVPAINDNPSAIFDGVNDFLKTSAFTLSQPEHFAIAFRSVTWTNSEAIFDGNADAGGELLQSGTTPTIGIHAGATAPTSSALPLNRFGLVHGTFRGATSVLWVDGVSSIGNAGANNMGGLTLGRPGTSSSQFGNVEIAELVLLSSDPGAYDRLRIENYLANKYKIPVTFDPTTINKLYAAFNPADKHANVTLSNNNLTANGPTGTGSTNGAVRSTQGKSSGKWYWEVTVDFIGLNAIAIGIGSGTQNLDAGSAYANLEGLRVIYSGTGNKYKPSTAYGAAYVAGDVLGCALDMDAGTFVIYKNGASQGTLVSGLTGTIYSYTMTPDGDAGGAGSKATANFGQFPFKYTVPTGFNAGLYTTGTYLQSWYKADSLGLADAASVTSWSDSSGNGRTIIPGTAPTLGVKRRNLKDGVRFVSASSQYLVNSGDASMVSATAGTVILVAKGNTLTGGKDVYSGASSRLKFEHTGTICSFCSDSASNRGDFTESTLLTSPQIYAYTYNGALVGNIERLKAWIGGAPKALSFTGTIPATLGTGNGTWIGTQGGAGAAYWDGDIYEVLVFSIALTDSQRQQIEGYLTAKYAINAAIKPFDPLSISGCKAWWQTDGGCDVSTDGAAIGTLYDRSGLGNHVIQATGTNKPLYKSGANGLNNLAISRLDTTDALVAAVTFAVLVGSTAGGNHAYTIFSVYKRTSSVGSFAASTNSQIFGDGSRNMYGVDSTGIASLAVYNGSAVNAPAGHQTDTATWQIGTAWSDATTLFVRQNGVAQSSIAGINNFASVAAQIGGISFAGDVAEIIVYDTALSAQDQRTVEAYLAAKYAIGYKAPDHASLLTNLKLWLDASSEAYADNVNLTNFHDRSGNGWDVVAGTVPTFQTFEYNGRPTGRFVAASSQYLTNTGFTSLNSVAGATLFVVAKATSAAVAQTLVNGNNSKMRLDCTAAGATRLIFDDSTYGEIAGAFGTTTRIWSGVFDGSQSTNATRLRLWRDGVLQTLTFTGTVGATMGSSNGYWVGNRYDLVNYFGGDILEVVLFTAALSDSDRRAVENYLAQKYNLVV